MITPHVVAVQTALHPTSGLAATARRYATAVTVHSYVYPAQAGEPVRSDMGVLSIKRPHVMLIPLLRGDNSALIALFVPGSKAIMDGREFTVHTYPEIMNAGLNTDHIRVVLEEVQYKNA